MEASIIPGLQLRGCAEGHQCSLGALELPIDCHSHGAHLVDGTRDKLVALTLIEAEDEHSRNGGDRQDIAEDQYPKAETDTERFPLGERHVRELLHIASYRLLGSRSSGDGSAR